MTVQVNAQTPLSLAMVSDLNMLNPHKNKTERRGPGREKRESLGRGERGAQREDLHASDAQNMPNLGVCPATYKSDRTN